MAREIDPEETFDDLYDELDYTEGRLEDEPDAAALAARIGPWRERVEAGEKESRAFSREATRTQAALDGANFALDTATDDYGAALYLSVGRDRDSARWRASFREPPSAFKRQPLATQAAGVRGWLTGLTDGTLDESRPRLEPATARAEKALARDATLPSKRGNLWSSRAALAAFLTTERDALEDELAAIGRTKGHDRAWARSFFRVTRRAKKPEPTKPV